MSFLQETHSKKDTESEWGGKILFSHGSSNSAGVAILIKNGFAFKEHSAILDPLGRYLIVKATIFDKQYVLLNIYALNKDKDLLAFLGTIKN